MRLPFSEAAWEIIKNVLGYEQLPDRKSVVPPMRKYISCTELDFLLAVIVGGNNHGYPTIRVCFDARRYFWLIYQNLVAWGYYSFSTRDSNERIYQFCKIGSKLFKRDTLFLCSSYLIHFSVLLKYRYGGPQ